MDVQASISGKNTSFFFISTSVLNLKTSSYITYKKSRAQRKPGKALGWPIPISADVNNVWRFIFTQ